MLSLLKHISVIQAAVLLHIPDMLTECETAAREENEAETGPSPSCHC